MLEACYYRSLSVCSTIVVPDVRAKAIPAPGGYRDAFFGELLHLAGPVEVVPGVVCGQDRGLHPLGTLAEWPDLLIY